MAYGLAPILSYPILSIVLFVNCLVLRLLSEDKVGFQFDRPDLHNY